ncbi:MAG: glycosyltransferase family 4 protein [Muribaculaceae bacterium]|nr:glycosyltransferase family 4 protein [Muribaculaceae bacterium]
MKIAYTISGLFNTGGMENILIQKANYLADIYGYDVTIITTDQKNRDVFFPLSPKVKLVDLSINYCDYIGTKMWLYHRARLKRIHRRRLKEHLSSGGYDICISLMDFDFDFLHKIKDRSKKLLEYHFSRYSKALSTNHPILKIIQKCRTSLWKSSIKRYDRFIVLTDEDKTQWGALPNIEVIPNFINLPPAYIASQDSKKIISVGRLSYQKGFDMLLQAWKIAQPQIPDWELNIFGGGDKTQYSDYIKQNGLKNITLHDPTSSITDEYRRSAFYVMSSRYEGLPLVLLEAMSHGLPIVSFKCPCGPTDILKEDFGILVPRDNVIELADAIVRCAENKEWRKQASITAVRESGKYSKDEIMKRWNDLFHSLLNN